jgi:hypothetical protein
MNKPFRQLDKVIELVESTGLEVTYAYEDIVFAEHSVFIIQFDDNKPGNLFLFFNVDCEAAQAISIENKLKEKAIEQKVSIENKGMFKLTEIEKDQEVQIEFIEK